MWYLGRVDPNKGCETLLRYFEEFVAREGSRVQLVLAGPVFMPVPTHPSIVSLGFVDESTRARLLDSAIALAVPSQYESLCIALLEGWNHALPALVNGRYELVPIPDPKLGPRKLDVATMYNTERYRPSYGNKLGVPLFLQRAS